MVRKNEYFYKVKNVNFYPKSCILKNQEDQFYMNIFPFLCEYGK